MDDSGCAKVLDVGVDWELESGASTPRSDTSSSSQDSVFSKPRTPVSPADTEMSFSSLDPDDEKHPDSSTKSKAINIPNYPNHIVAGSMLCSPGQLKVWRDTLEQARKTGEFPNTTSSVEDPKNIVEDYQHLQRLRDARGNPSLPPPEKYLMVKADIACRIKARDEAEASSPNFERVGGRVQGWMNAINQETRMLEITQAALQRRGISNPTQDDYDTIADEFMQIAERTLLDVANPLRMNASRMEGSISRFDGQLNGMGAQLDGLSSLNDSMSHSMSTQLDGLSSLNDSMSHSMSTQLDGLSSLNDSMSHSMTTHLDALNTMLSAQSSTFNGSVTMLNTALALSVPLARRKRRKVEKKTTLDTFNGTDIPASKPRKLMSTTIPEVAEMPWAPPGSDASDSKPRKLTQAAIPKVAEVPKDWAQPSETFEGQILWSSELPTQEQIGKLHGRGTGHDLTSWKEHRLLERLLVSIDFEARSEGLELPWAKIAHHLNPGSGPQAVQQFLDRTYNSLLDEGHVVPPPYRKYQSFPPKIRGYARDDTVEGGVRPVPYWEAYQNPAVPK
ncbi:hypothetical protein CkaCkLH20_04868 [Colletotrichum karsti]|uniref:Uncharacterized protein n=1 Tax=Colletotrichum karsti TaxID=1095194 RepID=A0A9P6I5M5_9PEZI|nr:uncharacterized protein CkaCkLH20_04868 [Colletotrichum karsti]KAF9877733.1 hypothetical protein CkaCkLH20_04868 [Colletotrichum karsti]